MAIENRIIRVEAGAVVVQVEGPDSLKAQEQLVNRLLKRVSDDKGRLPIGFQAGSAINLERMEEVL
jgi:hypothetical protein